MEILKKDGVGSLWKGKKHLRCCTLTFFFYNFGMASASRMTFMKIKAKLKEVLRINELKS